MHRKLKQLISSILALAMVCTLIPAGLTTPASAEDINEMDALSALGIDTSAIPEDYDPNSTDNPYGKNNITVQEVSELYMVRHNASMDETGIHYNPEMHLYGHNQALGKKITDLPSSHIQRTETNLELKPHGPYTHYAAAVSVAGNFDRNTEGKKSQVVTVGVDALSSNSILTGLDFNITDLSLDGNTPHYKYCDHPKTLITSKFLSEDISDVSSLFVTDGTGSTNNDFNSNPFMAYNYLKAVTGDFDGNGVDEIAVYVPNPLKSRIEIYRLETTGAEDEYLTMDNWKIAYSYYLEDQYERNPRHVSPSSNMVSLVSDDFNQDGTDDLAICWGFYDSATPHWNKETRAVLLYGNDDNNLIMQEQELPATFDGVPLYRASIIQGDLNNDDEKELILSGQRVDEIEKGNIYSRAVMIYNYKGDSFELGEKYNFQVVEDHNNNGKYDDEDGYPYYSAPNNITNVAVGRFDGLTSPVTLYLDSVLYEYGNDGLTAVARLDNNTGWNPDLRVYSEFGAMSGDFTGVGKETIFTHQFFFNKETIKEGFWFLPFYTVTHTLEPRLIIKNIYKENGNIETSEWYNSAIGDNYFDNTGLGISFCPVNTDRDTAYMRYTGERHLTYSDPKVLAVVASPPYFGDLAGDHLSGKYMESSTSYSDITGEGSQSSAQATLTIGAYVSYEQEFSILGVKIAQAEASTEITANFTYEFSQSKIMTQSVTYGTTAGMDVVAFYSIPMEIYVYDSVTPDLDSYGNVIGFTKQKMAVNIPHKARVVSMDLKKYEAIAKDYAELPQISGNTLTHTLGDPSSYPSSARNYFMAQVYQGDPAGVDYGETGWVGQQLTVEKETSHGFVITQQLEARAGMGAAGLTLGIIAGEEAGGGYAVITTEGNTYSGQIFNMPPEAEGYGYDYIWRLFTYVQPNEKCSFPVVSYLVEECTAPPVLPVDFKQDMARTTDTSVDLTWSYAGGASAFKIFRYYEFPEGSGNYEVASVSGLDTDSVSYDADGTRRSHYRFTDTDLQPYTEYRYVIQTVGTTVPTYSIPSKTLVARTKTSEGYPSLRLSYPDDARPEDIARNVLKVYPDRNATIGVIPENSDHYPQGFTYQWQKFNTDSNNWEDISAATYSSYTFRNTGVSDGGKYRCRVNTVYRGDTEYYITTYTDVFTLEYSLRTAELYDFSVSGGSTEGDTPSPVLIQAGIRSGHTNHSTIPMSTVSFLVESANYSATHHGKIDENGRISLELDLPQGYYTITPYYPGNRVFKSAELEPVNILVGNSGYQMEFEDAAGNEIKRSSIHFGDQMYFKLYKYEKLADGNLRKTALDMTHLGILIRYKDGFINHKYRALSSGSGEIDSVFPEQAQEPVNIFSAGVNELFMRLYLDENGEIIPLVDQGRTYEPAQTPTVTLEWSDSFYAKPRPVNIEFKKDSYFSEQGADKIQLPGLDELTITGLESGIWSKYPYDKHEDIYANDPYQDPRSNLRFNLNAYTTAGLIVRSFDSDNTIPGKYQLRIEPSEDTAASIMRNYEFRITPGTYYVTGSLHNIILDSRFEGTAQGIGTPGTVSVLTPQNALNQGKCSVGTNLVFTAEPFAGYELMDWEVNGVSQKTNSSVFAYTMLAEDTTITGVFRLKKNTLQFLAAPDHAGTVTEATMSTGGVVASGYPLTFTAVPESGYAFKEWQIVRGGIATTTPGQLQEDGSSVLSTEMSQTNMVVKALFEREEYILTLSDGLHAMYLDDVDGLINTPDEPVYVTSGAVIPGDKSVTVSAKPGYFIPVGSAWTVNDEVRSDIAGDSYSFTMTDSISISVPTENKLVDLTVEIRGPGLSQNAVVTSINGKPLTLPESFQNIPGGTEVSFEALAAYGYRFEKWQIDGEDAGINNVLTIPALDGDTVVSALFTANTLYHVEVAPNVGYGSLSYTIPAGNVSGTVNPAGGSIPVYAGADIVFTAKPAPLKMVDYWIVDGNKVYSADRSRTLTGIHENHTLSVGFKDMVYFDVDFNLENGDPVQSIQLLVNDKKVYTGGHVDSLPGGSKVTFIVTGPTSDKMVRRWFNTLPNGETQEVRRGEDLLVAGEYSTVLSGQLNVTAEMEALAFRQIHFNGDFCSLAEAEFTPDLRSDQQIADGQILIRNGGDGVLKFVPADGYVITGAEGPELESFVINAVDGSCVCTILSAAYSEDPVELVLTTIEKSKTRLVSFDTAGGSPVEPVRILYNTKVSCPEDPTSKGMYFGGWYSDSMLTTAYDFEAPVTRDLILFAKWLPEKPISNPFTDITGHWAESSILYCTNEGLFSGMTETEFGPDLTMTRAMMVSVLHRMEGSPASNGTNPFTDVSDTQWYTEAVSWAYENGIVAGMTATTFEPDTPITREQFCVIMANLAAENGLLVDTEGLKLFDDYNQISSWALPGMNYCYSVGLLYGDHHNMLHPRDDTTRAEGAAILMRYLLMMGD